jgi:hypothetical protein
MAHQTLPKNILHRKGRQLRPVRLYDVATLLHHVLEAAKNERVGFEDTHETLTSLTMKLNKKIFLDPNLIESSLWACNLLNEIGGFSHPQGKSLEDFIKDVLGKEGFNFTYNVIETKDGVL